MSLEAFLFTCLLWGSIIKYGLLGEKDGYKILKAGGWVCLIISGLGIIMGCWLIIFNPSQNIFAALLSVFSWSVIFLFSYMVLLAVKIINHAKAHHIGNCDFNHINFGDELQFMSI